MNKQFLLEQVGGNAGIAIAVIEEFESQIPLDIINIERHLQEGNTAAAGKVAHSIKGSCGVFGVEIPLRLVAAELEMVCRDGKREEAEQLFAKLREDAKKCLDYVPQLKASLS